jgi:hypothetical protein
MAQEPTKDWQPIETAPAGQWVLTYFGQFNGPCNVLSKMDDGTWVDEDDANYATPTHWMPLPDPPKEPHV